MALNRITLLFSVQTEELLDTSLDPRHHSLLRGSRLLLIRLLILQLQLMLLLSLLLKNGWHLPVGQGCHGH